MKLSSSFIGVVLPTFMASSSPSSAIATDNEIVSGLRTTEKRWSYQPAKGEQVIMNNIDVGCDIWQDRESLDLWQYRDELEQYTEAKDSKTKVSPDVRRLFDSNDFNREQVCAEHADVKPLETYTATTRELTTTHSHLRGPDEALSMPENRSGSPLQTFLNTAQHLSFSPQQGYIELLLPPELRHPGICDTPNLGKMEVVDYGHICRNKLQKHSRTVFVDIGATYNFDDRNSDSTFLLLDDYRKYGIHFDHIYAYESKHQNIKRTYNNIPPQLQQPLHWIDTDVNGIEDDDGNPFTMLKKSFKKDDFIVLKLSTIVTGIKRLLIQQLLKDPQLQEIVDVFYLDDSDTTNKTNHGPLESLRHLRSLGVATHCWI